jgi:hypothetical protein
MTDDNGNLSIDFLVGFTIFLLAFIWVVSIIPGLLIGLQAYTIDYDAVAYRTGVILAEDPGRSVLDLEPWESYYLQKANVTRFGLAITKETPNILSQDKINRFFCTTVFFYPEPEKDYHKRIIFGDYPYRFNISIRELGQNNTRSVGDVIPDGYGYIRRVVKIKDSSYATINSTNYINLDSVPSHVFSIRINSDNLMNEVRDPRHQINPSREQLTINITNLSKLINPSTTSISLTNVTLCFMDTKSSICYSPSSSNYPFVDGSSTRSTSLPATVNENITVKLDPAYINDRLKLGVNNIYIALRFDLTNTTDGSPYNGTFLNNTQVLPNMNTLWGNATFFDPETNVYNNFTHPFDYDYNSSEVTQPKLKDAVLEVAVW